MLSAETIKHALYFHTNKLRWSHQNKPQNHTFMLPLTLKPVFTRLGQNWRYFWCRLPIAHAIGFLGLLPSPMRGPSLSALHQLFFTISFWVVLGHCCRYSVFYCEMYICAFESSACSSSSPHVIFIHCVEAILHSASPEFSLCSLGHGWPADVLLLLMCTGCVAKDYSHYRHHCFALNAFAFSSPFSLSLYLFPPIWCCRNMKL